MGLSDFLINEAVAGRKPIRTLQGSAVSKSMVFDGGTTDDPGDFDGAGNPATLFTVTGFVKMRVIAKCLVDLVGASATLAVGTALSTSALIASTTATNIDANEIWHDNSPDASIEAESILTKSVVSQDVIQTTGTANITAGELLYICLWEPVSQDGCVTVSS